MDKQSAPSVDLSGLYLIGIGASLSHALLQSWFCDMVVIAQSSTQTMLRGRFADQSDLFGVLAVVRDLGLPLVYLEFIDEAQKVADDGSDD